MSASLPYKARSPWLRLNAVSPSPPRTRDGVPEIGTAANATKDSNLDKHTDASQAGDARTGRAAEDSSVSPSARPSLSKDGQKRHVSFIEPDTSTKEAEGGPEAAIDTRVPVEDPEGEFHGHPFLAASGHGQVVHEAGLTPLPTLPGSTTSNVRRVRRDGV